MATFAGDDAGPVLGIDLGTTFSCVAVYDDAEKSESPREQRRRADHTPSYVAFTETGRLVGAAAKSQAASNAKGTLFDVKRIIGRRFRTTSSRTSASACRFRSANIPRSPSDRWSR